MPPPIGLGTLTIANGTNQSEELWLDDEAAQYVRSLALLAPTTLPETIDVWVGVGSGPNWQPLYSGGAQVSLVASSVTVIDTIPFRALRLNVRSGNTAADRVFYVGGREEY